jgi:hypothetical protein
METEEKVKKIEEEFADITRQLKQLLLEIRIFCMEASSPLRDKSKLEQEGLDSPKNKPN